MTYRFVGYAQIGLGYADEEFHEKKSKIAEHVVHVDYSQKDFVVYLTEEGKLYGLGNDSTYMLLQLHHHVRTAHN